MPRPAVQARLPDAEPRLKELAFEHCCTVPCLESSRVGTCSGANLNGDPRLPLCGPLAAAGAAGAAAEALGGRPIWKLANPNSAPEPTESKLTIFAKPSTDLNCCTRRHELGTEAHAVWPSGSDSAFELGEEPEEPEARAEGEAAADGRKPNMLPRALLRRFPAVIVARCAEPAPNATEPRRKGSRDFGAFSERFESDVVRQFESDVARQRGEPESFESRGVAVARLAANLPTAEATVVRSQREAAELWRRRANNWLTRPTLCGSSAAAACTRPNSMTMPRTSSHALWQSCGVTEMRPSASTDEHWMRCSPGVYRTGYSSPASAASRPASASAKVGMRRSSDSLSVKSTSERSVPGSPAKKVDSSTPRK